MTVFFIRFCIKAKYAAFILIFAFFAIIRLFKVGSSIAISLLQRKSNGYMDPHIDGLVSLFSGYEIPAPNGSQRAAIQRCIPAGFFDPDFANFSFYIDQYGQNHGSLVSSPPGRSWIDGCGIFPI